jgi:hypothetical protein
MPLHSTQLHTGQFSSTAKHHKLVRKEAKAKTEMYWLLMYRLSYNYIKEYIFLNIKHFGSSYSSVPYLDLDHVEFTIQVLKLQDLPDEKVTITVSHLSVCDMDHFMVNVEIQLQQLIQFSFSLLRRRDAKSARRAQCFLHYQAALTPLMQGNAP